jgi:hypothetical protein
VHGKSALSPDQNLQLKALKHENDLSLKRLTSQQAEKTQEWDKKEKASRLDYWSSHSHGADRRKYIQDFVERRKAFKEELKKEKKQLSKENQLSYDQMKKGFYEMNAKKETLRPQSEPLTPQAK